jgi:DNA repair exonuclease SbcCD ATPase subunit
MFLVELVLQGIRGVQQARMRFQGGFNIVAAGNEAGKTTAVDAILRLLYPVNQPEKMESLVSRATPDQSRGALVIFSDDSSYYQIIQDFSKKAVNLSKHDPATKKFALQFKDWNSTSQFMAGLLPGISEEDYGRLFMFRRDSCSGQSSPVPAASLSAGAPALKGRPTAPAGRQSGQDAKLAELRETMRKAEEAADAEYKLDAAKIRLGEIAKKLDSMADARKHAEALEMEIEKLKVCEILPENLHELIENHEREQSEKRVKIDDLAQDIESLTLQRDAIPPANMVMDKLFIAGVAVGGLALVSGLFPFEGSDLYFPIGMLGSLLLIAAGWYNSSRKNVQRKTVQTEIDGLVKERAEIEKKFQDSGATIMKFMKTTDSKTAAELREKCDNFRHFQSQYRDLIEQQQMMQGSVNVDELQSEYARQQDEVATLDKAAKALAHNAVDTYSVRQEIERIEGEMSPSSHDRGSFGADLGGEPAPAAPQAAGGGVNLLAEIAVASRVSGIEIETLVPAVESAAQRNLTAVSAGKYVKVEVGPDGLPIVHDRSGAKLAFGTLSHGTREMACFCLRAGLVEAIAGKRRLPFVLDDPFAGFDPVRQQAACQLLRVLGTKTQVILFTSNPALRTASDVAVELK